MATEHGVSEISSVLFQSRVSYSSGSVTGLNCQLRRGSVPERRRTAVRVQRVKES